MNKSTARKIADSGITVGEIRTMLMNAFRDGDVDERRSILNRGMSKAAAFNIYWEGWENDDDSDVIKGSECISAANALREFGDFYDGAIPPNSRSTRPTPDSIFHEEAINPFVATVDDSGLPF